MIFIDFLPDRVALIISFVWITVRDALLKCLKRVLKISHDLLCIFGSLVWEFIIFMPLLFPFFFTIQYILQINLFFYSEATN